MTESPVDAAPLPRRRRRRLLSLRRLLMIGVPLLVLIGVGIVYLTGGRYAVVANSGAAEEQGACSLPGGKACSAGAWYAGTCSR